MGLFDGNEEMEQMFTMMSERVTETIMEIAEHYDGDSIEHTLARSIIGGTRLQLEALLSTVPYNEPDATIDPEIFDCYLACVVTSSKAVKMLGLKAKADDE